MMPFTTRIAAGVFTGLVLAASLAPSTAEARGTIERACLNSDRPGASGAVCGCIQAVADSMLTSREQRRGARFFAEPDLSQEARLSRQSGDAVFWEKWERFAATAEDYCR